MLSISKEDYVLTFLKKEAEAGRHSGIALISREKALEWHRSRKRNDGSYYFGHPNELVYILVLVGIIDENIIGAGFLHDVEEEEGISQEEIRKETNGIVAHLVHRMTKKKGMSSFELQMYFEAMAHDVRLVILKTIDRFINMRRSMFGVYNEKRMRKYIFETEEYILPISEHIIESGRHPEYENSLRLLRSFIKGILEAAKAHVRLMKIEEKNLQLVKELASIGGRVCA